MEALDGVAQRNAASAQELANSITESTEQAGILREIVGMFHCAKDDA